MKDPVFFGVILGTKIYEVPAPAALVLTIYICF